MTTNDRIAAIHESIDVIVENIKSMAKDSLERVDHFPSCTAAAAEEHVFQKLLEVGRSFMELYFDELGDGDCGFTFEEGGAVYRRKIRKVITLLTVFGKVEVDRFLYYAPGRKGYSPTAEHASLPDRQASYFLQRVIGRRAIRDTYEECVDFLKETFGISISTRTAENVILELAEKHAAFADELDVPEARPDETIQVVSFDGKGVPIVKDAPRSPARLKRGEKRNRKKEAMVGVEYVSAPHLRDPELLAKALVKPESLSEDDRMVLRRQRPADELYYQASLEAGREGIMEEIAERVKKREAAASHDLLQACLIDGAPKLARVAAREFPKATIILDIVHVSERFWDAAHLFHKEGTAQAKDMALELTLRSLQGRVGHVIGGLKQKAAKHNLCKAKTKKLEKILTYLQNHKQHMKYDRYLKLGFPIATGPVESACGHLVKDRMEKAGARWCMDGGEAMLRLRSIHKNGHWDEFMQFYREQEHERLYLKETAA